MTREEGAEVDLTGKVCVCSKGLVGVVEGRKELPWGLAWVGVRVSDGEPWSSRNPEVLANSRFEFELDTAKKGLSKAAALFGSLEGYEGTGLSVDEGEDGTPVCSVSMRFSGMPEGLAKFPEHIDVEGFDVPLTVKVG